MGIKIEPNTSLQDNVEHQLRTAEELERFAVLTTTGLQESTAIDQLRGCIFIALADKSFGTFHSIVTWNQEKKSA